MDKLYEKSDKIRTKIENKKIKLHNSYNVFDYIKEEFLSLKNEIVLAVFVDAKNNVMYKKLMNVGSINYSVIEPRDIIKECLINDVSGFFIIHNHPSGELEPSEDDLKITNTLLNICKYMNLRFLDHLVVNEDDFYSLYDHDLIEE